MSLMRSLQELAEFDTALLANTIGYIDPTPPHEYYMGGSIQSVTPTLAPTVGVAVTCELDTSTPGSRPDMDAYWRQLERITAMAEPVIWVVRAVGSRPDHECVLGDGMAKTLRAAGCHGIVTDGQVRDVPGCLSAGFAIYCKGKTVHHCAYRVRMVDQPVELGGITVRPGDVLHANDEGLIRIPQASLEELPGAAVHMRACEHEIHCRFRRTDLTPAEKHDGCAEVFDKYGFRSPPRRKKQ